MIGLIIVPVFCRVGFVWYGDHQKHQSTWTASHEYHSTILYSYCRHRCTVDGLRQTLRTAEHAPNVKEM